MRVVSRRVAAMGLGLLSALAVLGWSPPPAVAVPGPVTVSLTFNDGLASQYQFARSVLASHGVNGTFYVASNWMATTDAKYMRSWQLDNLYRDGNEVGGMGRDHKDLTATYNSDPAADLAYKRDQVCGDRQRLADLGYDPVSFSYPFAATNAAAQSVVSGCGYLSGRTVGGLSATGPTYAEAIPPSNPFRVSTLGTPNGPITLAAMQAAVNAAAARGGGWVPLAFNAVCDAGDAGYSSCMGGSKPVDAAVLSQFLDWIASAAAPAGTTVKTVRAVMGAAAQPPLPPRPTAVSLTFDDGDRSHYGVRSILAAHQVRGTFYINSGAIDDNEQGAMTWPMVTDLRDDGHDIGGHTRTHVNLTDPATTYASKWNQTCDDRARLVAQGFNPVSFAYPEGAFNSAAAGIVKGCGYQSGRTAGALSAAGPRYAESFTPTDPYTFQALGTTFNGPISLASLQASVDAAVGRGGGWIPMVFHEICYPGTDGYAACMGRYRPIDSTVLDDFLTWLDANAGRGISVRTVADVIGGGQVAPAVAVIAPAAGANGVRTTHQVTGIAAPDGGAVTVSLYPGRYTTVSPSSAVVVSPASDGTWSATVTASGTGDVTVQAAQTRNGVTGRSTPTTYRISGP